VLNDKEINTFEFTYPTSCT